MDPVEARPELTQSDRGSDSDGAPGSPLFQPEQNDDDHTKSDVILHTSDGLKFYVHKLILSQASPFFHDMFRLPQPPSRRPDGGSRPHGADGETPTLDLPEPSATWNRILQFLYPVPDPAFTSLDQTKPVLEAARKYQLEALTESMKKILLLPSFVEKEPLRVYAIACTYSLHDVARTAARFTLRYPMLGPCIEELDLIPASTYHRLLQYRQHCVTAAVRVASETTQRSNGRQSKSINWLPRWQSYVFFNNHYPCTCLPSSHWVCRFGENDNWQATPRAYWKELMDRAARAFMDRPCGETVTEVAVLAPAIQVASECEACRPKAYLHIHEFAKCLAAAVDTAISEIKLEVTQ